MTTPAPARTPSRPAPKLTGGATPQGKKFQVSDGPTEGGKRIVVHGPPSSGKTTLCSLIQKARFIDKDSEGSQGLDVSRVDGVATFDDAIEALQTPALWEGIDTIVLDSATAFQQLATLKVVGTPKPGETPKSIESFGFGKGYRHLFETMLLLLAALDRHIEQGRNVVLVCHSIVGNCPNPMGEDYSQHQLSLLQNNQGQLRTYVEGWAQHILFVNRDVTVKDGKGETKGTRAIQTVWSPWWVAKTRPFRVNGELRNLPTSIDYFDPNKHPNDAAEVWRLLNLNK
jgi:hypothetical protein